MDATLCLLVGAVHEHTVPLVGTNCGTGCGRVRSWTDLAAHVHGGPALVWKTRQKWAWRPVEITEIGRCPNSARQQNRISILARSYYCSVLRMGFLCKPQTVWVLLRYLLFNIDSIPWGFVGSCVILRFTQRRCARLCWGKGIPSDVPLNGLDTRFVSEESLSIVRTCELVVVAGWKVYLEDSL